MAIARKSLVLLGGFLAAAMPSIGAAAPFNLSDRGQYWSLMGGFVQTDSERDTREFGPSLSVLSGIYLVDVLAAELHMFGQMPQSRINGDRELGYGVGLDFNLGQPEPVAPFVILGGGGFFENIPGALNNQIASPYLNYGLGMYLPGLFFKDSLIRVEARYQQTFHDINAAGCLTLPCRRETLEDLRFNFGMQFGSDFDTPPYVPPPPPPPPVDSDRDGVNDRLDACPNTPLGTVVDLRGCPPPPPAPPKLLDGDNDGVPDSFDQCPNTATGVVVDEKGCPLPPPPPKVVDSDGDGVLDTADQCPNTPREYQVDDVGCVKVETLVLESVAFATGKAELTAAAKTALDSVAAAMKVHPSLSVEVAGHTDSTGSLKLNTALSDKRANTVRDYLSSQGIAAARLIAKGYGPSQPVADNKTTEGKARNRRVEFKLLAQ